MKRHLALSASATLLAGLLVGCGGGDEGGEGSADGGSGDSGSSEAEDYCTALEQAEEDLGALDGGDVGEFESAIETLRGVAEQAPEEVSGDWDVLIGAVTTLEDALTEAGLEFADLTTLNPAQLPEGVTQQDLQQVVQAAQEFSAPEVQQAGTAISTHAEEECGVQLGGGGESPSEGTSESPSEGASE